MNKTTRLLCIVCPMGCSMEATVDQTGDYVISGNTCQRGKDYALKEMIHPTRVLTTTIPIRNGTVKRLPVRSNQGVPKDKMKEWINEVKLLKIEAPVKAGDILARNILDTGTDVLASRSIGKADF